MTGEIMRHFVGGFMVGFIYILLKPGELSTGWYDRLALFIAATFLGLLTGTMVWGLWP